MITADHGPEVATFSGKCWGTETLSVAERHALALEAGVDQFGGNNDPEPLLEAFGLLEKKLGTEKTEERLRASAYRILLNIFRTGLYDDPYTDIQKTKKTVGCPEFTKEGYEAQKKSIVLLKNRDSVLPLARGTKVYIPSVQTAAGRDWFGNTFKAQQKLPVNVKIAEKYVSLCETPEEADAAVVIVRSPVSDGYDPQKKEYIPISLQYRPYTALKARKHSIAKGEPLENDCDRSYYGKTSKTTNESDLDMILNTRKAMSGKPVIVVITAKKPMVVNEFEKEADAILMHFGVQDDALFEILTGVSEPSGLLPFRMPADMDTVELHCEDLADDFEAYTDEAGNVYDFAFGMDYHGVIKDERTEKYKL
jgi:beta-glucosidase